MQANLHAAAAAVLAAVAVAAAAAHQAVPAERHSWGRQTARLPLQAHSGGGHEHRRRNENAQGRR